MGTGKTYTTGHVVEKLRNLNTHQFPRYLLCYHYCNDRETANAAYIYASLILQLLDQQKALMVDFAKWYQLTKTDEYVDPAQSSAALETFLTSCIEGLDRHVFVVIDGLDECENDSQAKIVNLFKILSMTAQRTKVFLSARPTKRLKHLLSDSTCITMSSSPNRDQIIARYSIEKHLSELEPDGRDTLLETLSRLADGNAQWIKIIVDLVATKGITINSGIKLFLKDLPNLTELSRVYAKAFLQVTAGNTGNVRLLTSALEILAVAQRSLSIQELGAAVVLATSGGKLHRVDEVQDLVDAGQILTCLQPFISQIDSSDLKKRQIRLGHHSLRELVWREAPSSWEQLSDDTLLSDDYVKSRQAQLEGNVLQICVKYLLLEEVDLCDLLPEEFKAALEWQQFPESDIFDIFDGSSDQNSPLQAYDAAANVEMVFYDPVESGLGPFFAYASCFWCDHLRVAAQELLPEIGDLVRLCRPGSTRLQNWTQQQLYPECTIRSSSGFDSSDLDALAVLSLSESRAALRNLLQNCDLNSEDFLHDSLKRAFDKISRIGNPSVLCLIFEHRNPTLEFPTFDFLYALMFAWKRLEKDSTRQYQWFDVIRNMVDTFVEERWGTTVLCTAVKFDCLPVITILFDEAKHNDALKREMLDHGELPSNTRGYKSFMMEAIQYGSYEILEYLLNREETWSDLHRLDEKQNNIFHVAALQGDAEKTSLLLRYSKESADQLNTFREAPLRIAVFGNHLELARALLMTGGVDVRGGHNANENAWEEPLRTAVRAQNLEMCRLLVEVGGADPWVALEKGEDGQLALKDSHVASPSVLNFLRSQANTPSSRDAA